MKFSSFISSSLFINIVILFSASSNLELHNLEIAIPSSNNLTESSKDKDSFSNLFVISSSLVINSY